MTIEKNEARKMIAEQAHAEGHDYSGIFTCPVCGKEVCDPAYDFEGNPFEAGAEMDEAETEWLCQDCVDTAQDDEEVEEDEEVEPCVVCGDDSTDWLPVWNGGNDWERKGTAHHCGCHTDAEVIEAYAAELDEEARNAGYANRDDMENPE